MTRARDVSRLVTTPPNIYATDSEASLGYLSLSSASSTYLTQANNRTAFKNLIINGDMQVAQRSSSVASITTNNYYTVDRWSFEPYTLGTWTMTQENDAPTGSGFRKSSKVLCTTADASPAAGDALIFVHRFEGQNLQQIAKGTSSAKELTVSFWVKSNVTGTYIAELRDIDNTRQVSKSYSISASATWEKKTITFPADTTGALDNDNGDSFRVQFWLAAGSNFTSGTLNTSWASITDANRVVGQVNLAASTNNYWQITGVQLEVGSTATEFEFLPADVELAQCQRYYYVHVKGDAAPVGLGTAFTTNRIDVYIPFPVTMRGTVNSKISSGTNHFYVARAGGISYFSSFIANSSTQNGALIYYASDLTITSGVGGHVVTNTASSLLAFESEL